MRWKLSWRADPRALPLADAHYNRQKVGSPQFVPPGRCLVLLTPCERAYWVTSWPIAEYVKHAWAGAWVCSAFRNEGAGLSSELITEAVQATLWKWHAAPEPHGFVTFVDGTKVKHKRDPGRCFKKAGWTLLKERTKEEGLFVYQLKPCDMPPPAAPIDAQGTLFV